MAKALNFAFSLVILDHDTGRFTTEGPMTDDGPWVAEIVFARRAGRQISCFAIPASAEVAGRHVEGCIRWPSGSIVRPDAFGAS